MASYMALPPLAQSESKRRLLQYLGLDNDNPQHKSIYGQMKREATGVAKWLMTNRDTLVPELQNNASTVPPFSSHQVSETAMHRQILNIYYNASAETKPYYDLAHDTSKQSPENWLIRWMLWHVFRYRDGRNKTRRNRLREEDNGSCEDGPSRDKSTTHDGQGQQDELLNKSFGNQGRRSIVIQARALPYDPIRDL